MIVAIVAILGLAGAAPADSREYGLADLDAVQALAAGCDDPVLDLPAYRGVDWNRDTRRLLSAMLRTDPGRCPGVAEAAAARITRDVGDPERSDVYLELLELAWQVAETGRGLPRDTDMADRYGRMLWLFADEPPALPRWADGAREAWLVRPATIALLEGRNAVPALRTRRSLQLLAGLRLRRDLAGYDPAEAANLLEDGRLMFNLENRMRFSRLLTAGEHLPPDHVRAARPYLFAVGLWPDREDPYLAELLRIARLALSAARTPVERAQALRLLAATSLDESGGELDAGLRRLGRLRSVPLAAGDAERVGRALDWKIAWATPYGCDDEARGLGPVTLDALIGPDGRVVTTRIALSSGAAECDRGVRIAWAQEGERADLSATARSRFVWTRLPPVDPGMSTSDAYERWGSPS
ncbi:hypothetical protein [Sphingosinicella terrae]|uniref:hypothetical protein n=1 Tax=Sphingosinicella terrae TaxID=2172047 RepID=UPI000E0D2BD9|nr:hypothetical protein [Sphingosinicella terrae]